MKCLLLLFFPLVLFAKVQLGIDVLLENKRYKDFLKGKKIGMLTHSAAVDNNLNLSYKRLQSEAHLVCLFCPEHGLDGSYIAAEKVPHNKTKNIPIYSLHGSTRRPTREMLKDLDLIIVDLQSIGCRSYTYISTLFYMMEEAAKASLPIMILDRPNPLGGNLVDGPMLDLNFRSFVGYINVPYIYGMTICELALFFNKEYNINAQLLLIPMKGWKRSMIFDETGLNWIPSSPHIPKAITAFFYPMTGILGELQIVNIGVGYTLPFSLVGAPWIDKEKFAKKLNEQKLPGVIFQPISYKPFYGRYANTTCHGAQIYLTDPKKVQPVRVQFTILSLLKSLYKKQMLQSLNEMQSRKEMFCKITGSNKIYEVLIKEKYPGSKMIEVDRKERKNFMKTREKYLSPLYQD